MLKRKHVAEEAARSADASLVFLPFRLRGSKPPGPFGGELEKLHALLPVTALVLAAEDTDLDQVILAAIHDVLHPQGAYVVCKPRGRAKQGAL